MNSERSSLLIPVVIVLVACTGPAALEDPRYEDDIGDTAGGKSLTADALTGHWEVYAGGPGRYGASPTGTIELTKTRFRLTFGDTVLALDATPSGTPAAGFYSPKSSTAIVVEHTEATLDTGAFPFALGGPWAFSAPSSGDPARCKGELTNVSFFAECTGRIRPPAPLPELRGSVQAIQTQVESAPVFGILGGTWKFANGCTAKFEERSVTWSCESGPLRGEAYLEFESSTSATGGANSNVFFTATKGSPGGEGKFAVER